MRIQSVLFLLLFLYNAEGQVAGGILSRSKVKFPPFSRSSTINEYYDSSSYVSAINDKSIQIEKVFYQSDGLKVVAYLGTPVKLERGKYPIIIFNRGSGVRNDIGYVYTPLFRKLIKEGFIVIAPALRGSEGGEGSDQLGGNDLDDIMNIIPVLSSLGYADTSKMFMLGESRGGIMTFLAIKRRFPLKAAATIGGLSDMEMYLKDNPWSEGALKQLYPDYDKNRQQILQSRSVLNWAEAINTPVLIMNGQADTQVRPYQALNLAQKLSASGKAFQLVIIEGGNHRLSGKSASERDRQIIDWFKKYL